MRIRGAWRLSLVLLLVAASCTNVSTVPPSHYRDPEYGLSYRVHTTSGTTYYVADFTADKFTFIILRFRLLDKADAPPPPAPFYIPLGEVAWVEKVRPSDSVPLVLAAVFVAIIGIGIAAGAGGAGD